MTPSYGRKGHLKAIWLRQQDGGNPIDTQPRGRHALQLPPAARNRKPVLEASPSGWTGRRRRDRDDAGGIPAGSAGLRGPVKRPKHSAGDALMAGGEAVGIHQVLPNGLGVAALGQSQLNAIAIRFTGAGRWTGARLCCRRRRSFPGCQQLRVGGHGSVGLAGFSGSADWPVVGFGVPSRGSPDWPVLETTGPGGRSGMPASFR